MKRKALNPITIRIPATTGNVGPGFDTLGIALKLYSCVRVQQVEAKETRIVSPIAESDRAGATAMVAEAAKLFFRRAAKPEFSIEVAVTGDVPIARGLGSSVTVRLGVIAALNEFTGAKFTRHALLEIVTQLEHHPDNAAAAIFGGFTVAGVFGGNIRCISFPVDSKARFVALIPRFEISTEKARKLLPKTFSKADTVHALNHAAMISATFASGNYAGLRGLFEDRIHQPYRKQLIPQLSRVIRSGEKAGAVGGWLSGSGPTIICLTLEKPEAVAKAMQKELPDSEMKILAADIEGFRRHWEKVVS